MDSISASGSAMDIGSAYLAAMAKRTQDQTKVDGQAALRLIDAATVASQPAPLPPDATVSVLA
jgi:hypothetical protein